MMMYSLSIALCCQFGATHSAYSASRFEEAQTAIASLDHLPAFPFSEYSLQQVRLEHGPAGLVFVTLSLDADLVTLVLREHGVRIEDGPIRVIGAEAGSHTGAAAPTTYRGSISGRPDVCVAASIASDGIRANIYAPGERGPWTIQPIRDFHGRRDAADGRHVVTRASHTLPRPVRCGGVCVPVAARGSVERDAAVRGPDGSCLRLLGMRIEADFEFFQQFGSVAGAVAAIEGYVNQLSYICERDLALRVEIEELVIHAAPAPPNHSFLAGENASSILASYQAHLSHFELDSDVAFLLSGRELGGVNGATYLGSGCSTAGWSCGVVRVVEVDLNARVASIAHELGHNLGCWDDNIGSTCRHAPAGHIMSASVSTHLMSYSSCSVGYMNNHLWGAGGLCLERVNPGSPFTRADEGDAARGYAAYIDVLSNDLSCEQMLIELDSPFTLEGASIEVSSSGWAGLDRILYTPRQGMPAADTFFYRAVNVDGSSSPVEVAVRIHDVLPDTALRGARRGLEARYYEVPPGTSMLPNFDALSPILETIAPTIDFPETDGSFAESGQENFVGAVFTGYVELARAGLFTFYLESDEGSRLEIDGQVVIDHDGLHSVQEASGVIALEAGRHSLRVEYFEQSGPSALVMRWFGPGLGRQVVPDERLFHVPECPTDIDRNHVTDVADIFAFLLLWFADDIDADWNGSGSVAPQDIFEFLSDWFAAAGPC